MNNFIYNIPTKIYFGKGQIKHLGRIVREFGKNVLLVYGGGSIKKIGLYDEAVKLLKDKGVVLTELGGVEPNPRIASVREGQNLCLKNNIDVILAIGGGSSIDCAKIIAASAKYDGDPWDLVLDSGKIKDALPIISVLTLSATGSEMDGFAVISDLESNNKIGVGSDILRPKASILDPQYTYTVSRFQTAAGIADIISHIMEVYFNNNEGIFLQNSLAESLLKTCIRYGKTAVFDPKNYEARANLMWASSLAINGLLRCGVNITWCIHPMEHELSAYYDITHGAGLAILTPHWMQYVLNKKRNSSDFVDKFIYFGVNVWGLDPNLERLEIAEKSIDLLRKFFKDIGLPSKLKDVSIGSENLEIMAEKATREGFENAFMPLSKNDVLEIFKMAL